MAQIKQIKFSVDNWTYLYSLTQAVIQQKNNSAINLQVQGRFLHKDFGSAEQSIKIRFIYVDTPLQYAATPDNQYILGHLDVIENTLTADIEVLEPVFKELKKNLIEYADIEGIHMIFSLGLVSTSQEKQYSIVQLDYAMKGDR